MNIMFIGGMYDNLHLPEILSYSKQHSDFAANLFQKRILQGFEQLSIPLHVVSLPFIKAYPFGSKKIHFDGFNKEDKTGWTYLNFCNIFGIRNFSRRNAVYNAIIKYASSVEGDILLILYSPHTPFIEAAAKAKRKISRLKICIVIPDCPQYMNLSEHIPIYYRVAKCLDIKRYYKFQTYADSFILLTKHMASLLAVNGRPFEVLEGIAESDTHSTVKKLKFENPTIAYTGTLHEAFGVINLVHSFMTIKDPSLRLIICGTGDATDKILRCAQVDTRIDFRGIVSPDEAKDIIQRAHVLVNPRQNNSEYTKFSFPSKYVEYLLSGNPVVGYKLDGMPEVYGEFIHYVEDNTIECLAETILNVLKLEQEAIEFRAEMAKRYITSKLDCKAFALAILKINHVS